MIRVEGLTKYYGERAAIRDLSFEIAKGEVAGFLGLNGAGKTTTLKILGCVLLPTAGHVSIEGFDVLHSPHEIRKRIGFLPDTPPLYDEMTVGGYLSFVARLRGVASDKAAARVAEVEERVSLRAVHRDVISQLSHGYRQRVGVAQALVLNPSLLILDEPSSGLDPKQIIDMRGLIRDLKGQHTVLVSSHILSEVSQICDRLLVIDNGRLVAQGTEAELARGSYEVVLDIRGSSEVALEALRKVPGVTEAKLQREADGISSLRVTSNAEVRPQLARTLVQLNVDLLAMNASAEQLESTFLKLTHSKAEA